jgi:hypothetical protein
LTGVAFAATMRRMRWTGADVRVVAFSLAAFAAAIGAPARVSLAAEKNACGCYQTDGGSCYCDKKAKCGCPGQCEPKGCEEKRQKEIDKEISAETKRAKENARSHGGATAKETGTSERAPAPAKALTAAQLRELGRLLGEYVAAHPGEKDKGIGDLARDLSRAPE